MDQQAVQKMIEAQDRLLTDPKYIELMQTYRHHTEAFEKVLRSLPKDKQEVILDLLYVWEQMHLHLLEEITAV